jgi:predicted nucleic acid-binding protein
VIYLDSSVVLAQLLMERRRPPAALWREVLGASRLLQYEVWNRIHARGLARSHGTEVQDVLARIYLVDMSDAVLARALQPFPITIRTLDALHLATIECLRVQGETVELASYDARLIAAAQTLAVPLAAL